MGSEGVVLGGVTDERGRGDGDAGLLVERVGFNAAGAAIEFSQSFYRGDTYDFVAELSLVE